LVVDVAGGGVVPLHLDLVREVLALDGVLAGPIPVALCDGADAEDRRPPLVGNDAVARLDLVKQPYLVWPRAALVRVVLGHRNCLEVGLRERGDVAELGPADGGDASLPPLRPRDAISTRSDLPVASVGRGCRRLGRNGVRRRGDGDGAEDSAKVGLVVSEELGAVLGLQLLRFVLRAHEQVRLEAHGQNDQRLVASNPEATATAHVHERDERS
jgi:hypothetical protein